MSDQGDLSRALRFAVSHIQPGSSGPSAPMNDQDREWLSEVIGQMASRDAAQKDTDGKLEFRGISDVLKSFVQLLENETAHRQDCVSSELQHIAEEAELMDRADDCERRNSVASIKTIFDKAIPEMIAPLCSILAELAQNSPDCQAEAMPLIPRLVEIVRSADQTAPTKSKAVYALSAILRGNPSLDVEKHLLANGNCKEGVLDVLADTVCDKKESVQVRTKAAFLINCLVSFHEVRQYLFKNYEKKFKDLQEEDENIKELIDGTLKSIQTKQLAGNKAPLALKM